MSTVNGFQVGSETLKYNYESLDNYNTPNFSTSSSTAYAVGDYVMYNGKLYKCTTATTGGTWVSSSWILAVLSDDVSDIEENQIPELKNALSDIIVFKKKINYIKDYYVNLNYETGSVVNLTPAGGTGWEYAVLDCSEGDQFLINAQGSTIFQRVWGFVDADNKMLTKSTEQNVNETIIAPQNASKIILNNQTIYTSDSYTLTGNNLIGEMTDEIETLTTNVQQLNSNVDSIVEVMMYDITYPNIGFINISGVIVRNQDFRHSDFIKADNIYKHVSAYWHPGIATFAFYDADKNYLNEYINKPTAHFAEDDIVIPDNAVYVIVSSYNLYTNKVYKGDKDIFEKYDAELFGTNTSYGNNGAITTTVAGSDGETVCPCKSVNKNGIIKSIYVNSQSSGIAKLYVGEVDQLYLFIPRKSYEIQVEVGEQNIDVSNMNIYVNKGENVLFKFIGRGTLATIDGDPEGDNSFYFSVPGTMQLSVYGAPKAIVFGFGYTLNSSKNNEQDAMISENSEEITSIYADLSTLQSNYNIISDRNGNKYRMIVQNGSIVLLPMNFRHVLCIGNSFTIHTTVDDTEPGYVTDLWWGHWAMAASSQEAAWTSLLQNALRQKNSDAVVTSVLGRRYEYGNNTYTLDNPDTFTYWDGTAWQSLKENLSEFSDVDAIVFFLGANYSGDDWYTLYSAMVDQFLIWFPNSSLFCCSCASNSMPAKDTAIQTVANEKSATYISFIGLGGKSKVGAFVKGDDGNLHQINNSAVAGHFGDYGEYLINDKLCSTMGYVNNTILYEITITNSTGIELLPVSSKTTPGSVVSIFANISSGITLSSITVKDDNNNAIAVIDHGVTDYGRIFTFIMPNSNVTITANGS